MINTSFSAVLRSVILHWDQSAKAYADYMANGKKFRYAKILRVHNTAVKKLLTDNFSMVPEDHIQDVEAILEHYRIWTEKWDELKSSLDPGPEDEFIFQNEHRFPKVAAQRLEHAI